MKQPINIKLEAQEWQQVVNILQDVALPWRISNPLLVSLLTQLEEYRKQLNGGGANKLTEEESAELRSQ